MLCLVSLWFIVYLFALFVVLLLLCVYYLGSVVEGLSVWLDLLCCLWLFVVLCYCLRDLLGVLGFIDLVIDCLIVYVVFGDCNGWLVVVIDCVVCWVLAWAVSVCLVCLGMFGCCWFGCCGLECCGWLLVLEFNVCYLFKYC